MFIHGSVLTLLLTEFYMASKENSLVVQLFKNGYGYNFIGHRRVKVHSFIT